MCTLRRIAVELLLREQQAMFFDSIMFHARMQTASTAARTPPAVATALKVHSHKE